MGPSQSILVYAPGVNIDSLAPGGGPPVPMTGSSMAAPYVAGLAALLLEVNPELRHDVKKLRTMIVDTALQSVAGQNGEMNRAVSRGWAIIKAQSER